MSPRGGALSFDRGNARRLMALISLSVLGVKKSLSHAQIGILLGFDSNFPKSWSPPPSHGSPPELTQFDLFELLVE